MNGLHQGLDYKLYKIYVWGGLFLIVVHIVVSTLVFDALNLPGSRVFLLLAGPMLIWFAGILLYWWWVFLFKGNRELNELGRAQGQRVPGIQVLKSWSTLHQAMAIHGGDAKELIKNERKTKRPMLVWYGSVNLLALWIICPVALGSLEIFRLDPGIWLAGVLVWVILMLVGTPILLGWGAKSMGDAYLTPLGLAVTRTPELGVGVIGLIGGGQKLIPDGPAIVEGERYRRLVHIETIDQHNLTVVQARAPEFKVQSNDGKLVPDEGAPEAVAKALRSLRKAKRWRGIAVYAHPEGIAVQRRSTGTNMWLYDLWLAEHLLDEISDSFGLSESESDET
ncbi:MAG: hypothetical protein JXM73_15090 [Anaerolineae bacterium]|nr:hypothetical protein [Anaerolineae bacterium]